MPKVSIVVPNYNHARFLQRRIQSVLRQSFQDFELILLDDCSTDDSELILSEYAGDSRVRIEFNEVNSGSPFKQWNKGVGLARGEYVWIAESDDYADERLLEKLAVRLDADAGVAFAYCRSWCVGLDDRIDGFADPWRQPERWAANYCADGYAECRDNLVYCNTILNASAVVFRKTIYQHVGGADESLQLCGDWKLWAAMALAGKIVYLAEPLNYFRFHLASVRNVTNRMGTDLGEIFRVRWWVLDRVSQLQTRVANEGMKLALARGCMDLAFDSYPNFPDITRLALQRLRDLGGTDYTPPFATWKGEVLKRIIGWKATKWAHIFYHRCRARSDMGTGEEASSVARTTC